jgi:hypothetical protein
MFKLTLKNLDSHNDQSFGSGDEIQLTVRVAAKNEFT